MRIMLRRRGAQLWFRAQGSGLRRERFNTALWHSTFASLRDKCALAVPVPRSCCRSLFLSGKTWGIGDAGALYDEDELASVIRAIAKYGSQKKSVKITWALNPV